MTTFILGFILMLCILAIMSVGVIFMRKPIKGSCGGLSALGMKESCEICGGKQDRCEEEQQKTTAAASTSLAYDATRPSDAGKTAPR